LRKNVAFAPMFSDELAGLKIPALSGRGSKNNRLIIRTIALKGPMLKYAIHKDVSIGLYSTVSRRVDSLVEREYLAEASKRVTARGKRMPESEYGLTWRGFIASITIKEVRENIPQVLEKNRLLAFPEKELILPLMKELVTPHELEVIARSILEAYLKTIPSLELVSNEPMSLLTWFFNIRDKPKFPEGFKLSKWPKDSEELLDLLDKPSILKAIKEIVVPLIRQQTVAAEEWHKLLSVFNRFGSFIANLEVEDQPSKRVKEFLKTELLPRLSELQEA